MALPNKPAPDVVASEADGAAAFPGQGFDGRSIVADERIQAKSRSEDARLRLAAVAFLRGLVSREVRA